MERIIIETNNIETLYSIFTGKIHSIYMTLKIIVNDDVNNIMIDNPKFRHSLFIKAEQFFRYNNPHSYSSVIIISPYETDPSHSNYHFWNNPHDNLSSSYNLKIELHLDKSDLDGCLQKVDNYKELMDHAVLEFDQKRLKYIEELVPNKFVPPYMLNYL
jgi:hypothetical protein